MRRTKRGLKRARVGGIISEPMERRLLMSTYTVNTLSDAVAPVAGMLTLRQAVADANLHAGADSINFDSSVFAAGSPHTILLTQGQINLTDTSGATTITGPGDSVLAINGSNASRIFQISSGVTVSISGVTITGGEVSSAPDESAIGGSVENSGSLTLTNVNVSGNSVTAGNGGTAQGGGLFSSNSLWVINSTISGNTAQGGNDVSSQGGGPEGGSSSGGGIWSTGLLNVSNSVVSGNTAAGGAGPRDSFSGLGGYAEGGGVYTSGSFTLTSTTVSNNTAHGGPDSYGGASSGGGIYTLGQADLVDSTCSGNQALGGGGCSDNGGSGGSASGGALFSNATVTVNSTTFTSNKAYGGYSPIQDNGPAGNAYGGAITALGSITLTGSMLNENQAVGGGGDGNSGAQPPDANGSGGGLYATATLVIAGCTISGNSAQGAGDASYGADGGTGQGGGIAATGTATLSASSVTGNSAIGGTGAGRGAEHGNHGNGGEGEGGGAFSGGTLTVTDSTISGNQSDGGAGQYDDPDDGFAYAGSGGAAVGGGLASVGELNISNSTIANNDASGGVGADDGGNAVTGGNGGDAQGGGIFASMSITLADMTVVGNTTVGGAGGAAWPNDSPPTPGATGSAQGGGICAGNGTVLNNSILSANNGVSGADVYSSLSTTSGYNLIGYGGGVTNGVNGNKIGIHDPLLLPLANNGGPTLTMLPMAGSPVIDAGSNALIPSGVTTDQRGASRISNGIVDIGAVEVQQSHVVAPTPVITLTAAGNQTATAGTSSPINLGSFTQSNATGPFAVTIDWGDGSANSSASVAAAGTIPARTHEYSSPGNDTVTLTVADSAGDVSGTESFVVTVSAAPSTPTVPVVSAVPSTTSLTASTILVAGGSEVKLIAEVSGDSAALPTGTATFSLNGSVLGTQDLQAGTATFTTGVVPVGTDVFTASYGGDGNDAAGSSSPLSVTVASASLVSSDFIRPVFPPVVVAGTKFNARLPLSLANTGPAIKGVFKIRCYLNTSADLDGGQVLLSSSSRKISLKTGRRAVITTIIRSLPASLPGGAYYLLAEVVDPNGVVSVAATSSTVAVAAPVVNLSATVGAVTPAVLTARKPGLLSITIANSGNIAASGLLVLTVSPSSDGQTGLPVVLASVSAKISVPPGRPRILRMRIKVPATLSAGAYFPYVSIGLGGNNLTAVGSTAFVVG